jgi:U3 small nucleolar RNA-associated protein 12
LELVDVSGCRVIESIACHEGAVWDVQIAHDKKGLVTASADKVRKNILVFVFCVVNG